MENILNQLTDEQAQIALEIAQKARAMGVDPRLAVALAYRESGLNPAAIGSSGEVGLMQVMPSTAKMMGFTKEDLQNPSKNIEIGLSYLKQGLDKFGGDPVLAAAGYNAGLDHPYFSDPEKASLPDSTKEYLKSINQIGGFTPSPSQAPQDQDESAKTITPPSEDDFVANKLRLAMDLGAAGTGALASKGLQGIASAGGKLGSLVGDIGTIAESVRNAPPQGMPRPVGGPAGPVGGPVSPLQQPGLVPTDEMHTRQLQGTTEQGATGRARQATYNEMTAQQAARRKMQEGVLGKLMQQNVIGQTADDVLARMPGMTATPSGVLAPSSAVYPQAQPSVAPPQPPAPARPGPLSQAGGMAKKAIGAVAGSPVLSGALGGLSMAESGQEFFNRYKQGDIPGMMISGAGAVGGGMQMLPAPQAKALGAGLSAASPLTMYLYDKLRGRGKFEGPLTPQEQAIANKPAFVYPNP